MTTENAVSGQVKCEKRKKKWSYAPSPSQRHAPRSKEEFVEAVGLSRCHAPDIGTGR